MIYCNKCGKVSPDGTKFCGECGNLLDPTAEEVNRNTVSQEENVESNVYQETSNYQTESQYSFQQETHYHQPETEHYETGNVETTFVEQEPKCWRVFGKIGFILGLISFICSFTIILSVVSVYISEPAIVFSALGKKTKDEEYKSKANKGLVFSIISLAVGFIGYIIFLVVMQLFEASDGTYGGATSFIKLFLMK